MPAARCSGDIPSCSPAAFDLQRLPTLKRDYPAHGTVLCDDDPAPVCCECGTRRQPPSLLMWGWEIIQHRMVGFRKVRVNQPLRNVDEREMLLIFCRCCLF